MIGSWSLAVSARVDEVEGGRQQAKTKKMPRRVVLYATIRSQQLLPADCN